MGHPVIWPDMGCSYWALARQYVSFDTKFVNAPILHHLAVSNVWLHSPQRPFEMNHMEQLLLNRINCSFELVRELCIRILCRSGGAWSHRRIFFVFESFSAKSIVQHFAVLA